MFVVSVVVVNSLWSLVEQKSKSGIGISDFFSKNANKISSVGSSRIGVLQVRRIRNQDLRKDHCSR